MISIREYAKKSGLSYAMVKEKCVNGEIHCEKTPGGHIQIYPSEIKRIISPKNYIDIEEYQRVVNELEKAKRILKRIKDEFEE